MATRRNCYRNFNVAQVELSSKLNLSYVENKYYRRTKCEKMNGGATYTRDLFTSFGIIKLSIKMRYFIGFYIQLVNH